MEKPGIGRAITLAQMRDECINIDVCVIGGLAFNKQGVIVWEGHNLFEVQWAMLQDMKILGSEVPVIAAAHACQVVDEAQLGLENVRPNERGEVQCDFVVTPEEVIAIDKAQKPTGGIDFERVDPDGLHSIPPLQELRGIRMMDQIMQREGFISEKEEKPETPSADEEMGISIVEKLMKGYRA
jgi:5-formyltetrahydrofolate cyclo-ligase